MIYLYKKIIKERIMKSNIKGFMLFCLLFTFALSLFNHIDLYATAAPSFTIETIDGDRIRSETLLEKGPLFLEFWNIGCRPCLLFLPHVSDFAQKFPEMTFVAVNTDGPRHVNSAISRVRSSRWAFTTALDGTRDLQRLFGVSSNPHTIIINQSGEIVYNSTGFIAGDETKYESMIIDLLRGNDE
jgi:thiol-disulfide isomerase/thioredoxin